MFLFLKESYIFRIYFSIKIMMCPVQKATLIKKFKNHEYRRIMNMWFLFD